MAIIGGIPHFQTYPYIFQYFSHEFWKFPFNESFDSPWYPLVLERCRAPDLEPWLEKPSGAENQDHKVMDEHTKEVYIYNNLYIYIYT